MSRARRIAVAVALASLLVASASPALAAGDTYVSISDATVTPSAPAPGDTFTVSTTVRNLQSSANGFTLRYVRIVEDGRVRAYVSDLGSLGPGSELTVPLTASFSRPGTHELRVEAGGTTDDGHSKTVTYPVVVHVNDRAASVELDGSDVVADATSPLNVTVTNGLDSPMRNVRVDLDGVPAAESRRVLPTVAAGEQATATFDVRAERAGETNVTATVRYSSDGVAGSATREATVAVAERRDDVSLATRRTAAGSALAVTVTNLGNAALRDVAVTGESDAATVTGATTSLVPAGEARTVVLNASDVDGQASVRVSAAYDYGPGTDRRTAETTSTVAANPGRVRLTGVSMERENGKLHVSGSASNVGLESVNSAVVSVRRGAGVEPAYPGREYFVGTIPASDFVGFDVYAAVGANATAVPLEVSYLADGVQKSETVTVPIEGASPSQPADTGGSSGGGWLVPALVGLVVVAGVGALMYVGWRNYRRE